MARPTKYTVDFFPHYCQHGKTMFIIESRYGNDGYAFWFKLLETLGASRGHYLNLTNPLDLEFLGAKTRLSVPVTTDLLNLLAELDAIDKELWDKKIVWSQHLRENLNEVYDQRKGLSPEKPYYQDGKLVQNIDNHHNNSVTSTDNTQSRVDYTKLNKTILDNKALLAVQAPPKKTPAVKTITDNSRGDKVKEVFARIDKIRGYRPPKRQAEAASIIRMLKIYTPDQIINTWQQIKSEPFYSDKELFLMTVESQIGAKINGVHQPIKKQPGADTFKANDDPLKFQKGRYANMVVTDAAGLAERKALKEERNAQPLEETEK